MRRPRLVPCGSMLLFVAFLALTSTVAAQTTTGGVTGVVQDAGGLVLPGVTLKATHDATNAQTVAVTNEVGMSVVPERLSGRVFRDILGTVNQRVAEECEDVMLVVAGRALRL